MKSYIGHKYFRSLNPHRDANGKIHCSTNLFKKMCAHDSTVTGQELTITRSNSARSSLSFALWQVFAENFLFGLVKRVWVTTVCQSVI